MMGKVTVKELPKDHPIFKAGWIISTIKKQPKKTQSFEKLKDTQSKKKVSF